jgi:hypothetical protein
LLRNLQRLKLKSSPGNREARLQNVERLVDHGGMSKYGKLRR